VIRTVQIASIVEGDGEVQALPVLLRRLAAMIDPAVAVEAHPPIRLPRTKVHVLDAYERCIELASRRVAGNAGGVLVLLDVDDGCAATLGAELCRRAEAQRPDVHVAVVLAVRELEAWFLAGATSIAGRRGLPEDLGVPEEPEAIRGAKEWLQRHRKLPPSAGQPPVVRRLENLRRELIDPSGDHNEEEVVDDTVTTAA
jgi:hypothetical protein